MLDRLERRHVMGYLFLLGGKLLLIGGELFYAAPYQCKIKGDRLKLLPEYTTIVATVTASLAGALSCSVRTVR